MIKWMACLGQQLVPGLDTLDQRKLLPRNPQQRSRLIVVNNKTHNHTTTQQNITTTQLKSYKQIMPY